MFGVDLIPKEPYKEIVVRKQQEVVCLRAFGLEFGTLKP